MRHAIKYGHVHSTSNNYEGVLIWLNSELIKTSIFTYIRCGILKGIRKIGLKAAKRMLNVIDFCFELYEKYVSEPHWYLSTLGIRPELQRKGFGSLLLNEMLKITINDNRPYYLETHNQDNIKFF